MTDSPSLAEPPSWLQARQAMSSMPDMDWFFCRGYFLQASNSFKSYTQEELGAPELGVSCAGRWLIRFAV